MRPMKAPAAVVVLTPRCSHTAGMSRGLPPNTSFSKHSCRLRGRLLAVSQQNLCSRYPTHDGSGRFSALRPCTRNVTPSCAVALLSSSRCAHWAKACWSSVTSRTSPIGHSAITGGGRGCRVTPPTRRAGAMVARMQGETGVAGRVAGRAGAARTPGTERTSVAMTEATGGGVRTEAAQAAD